MNRLDGKVCVVTGAGQGIGRAIAGRFAEEGAVVVAAQRSRGDHGDAVDALGAAGSPAAFVRTDVTRPEEVAALFAETLDRFGRVDVLCNNAGTGLSRSIVDTTPEEYRRVMDVNVGGVFNCCHAVLPHMLSRGSGVIVNIASVAAFVAFPREPVYCASKAAVLMLTRQLGYEFASAGIRVNAICPGFVETPALQRYVGEQEDPESARAKLSGRQPMGRVATPDEIAAAAAFLASDDSSFITGADLVVDGGLLTRP